MIKRAVIYKRVSDDDQVDGTSLDTQEADCRAYCKRQGWQVVQAFEDAGKSAKTANREDFQNMLAFCRENAVQYVVLTRLSRFARNLLDQLQAMAELREVGALVASMSEGVFEGRSGRLLSNILGAVNEDFNAQNAEQSRRGMEETARRGGWNHMAPLGYVLARTPDGLPILAPHPELGPIVRQMFLGFADGRFDLGQISRTLSAAASKHVRTDHALKMLISPIYGGIIRSKVTRCVEIKAAFPGLVTADEFEAVQAALARRKPAEIVPRRHHFALRGSLECVAGHRITASFSRGRGGLYGYYHCNHCGQRHRADALEARFTGFVEETRANALPVMGLLAAIVRDVNTQDQAGEEKARAAAAKELASTELKSKRLLDLYLSGGLESDQYKRKAQELKSVMQRARAVAQHMPAVDIEAQIATANDLITNMGEHLQKADFEHRKRLVLAYFGDRIVVDPSGALAEKSNPANQGLITHLRGVAVRHSQSGTP